MQDSSGKTIYVGKAKILRRRLQQYRNARRCKKHHKMRAILAEASAICFTACNTDLDALLLENELIRALRPRFNLAGAFSFLYPCIGLRREGLNLYLCYSTSPAEFGMFDFFGAFRSRALTREGFLALLEVLRFIVHREPTKSLSSFPRVRFSIVAGYRQIGDQWPPLLETFLRGESKEFLEKAVMALVEKPFARRHAADTQELIDTVMRFYRFEAHPLRKAMKDIGLSGKLVSQEERDGVFLRARHEPKFKKISRAKASPPA
ncbi:MAG: GIY-YIG nuclease family protein [Deltaproteobacteria bacterium]|nr:GIY-YIG nuclease family protein [Deltaproteobacteria bacterium]